MYHVPHRHSGTPSGTVEQIGGVNSTHDPIAETFQTDAPTSPAYVAKSNDSSKAKTVIFIADIFGYELPNVRLLADEFAKNGLHVLIPDLFDGDYVPHDLLKAIVPQESDETPGLVEAGVQKAKVAASLGPWVFKHREG